MEIKPQRIELLISLEEVTALTKLLGEMSPDSMKKYVNDVEAILLVRMYDVLSKCK